MVLIKFDYFEVIDVDFVVEDLVCRILFWMCFWDVVYGEECVDIGDGFCWWIIDLIDGIVNFLCGVLVWVIFIVFSVED